jgi:hypothetical protein
MNGPMTGQVFNEGFVAQPKQQDAGTLVNFCSCPAEAASPPVARVFPWPISAWRNPLFQFFISSLSLRIYNSSGQ